jgi:hypothetical protein
VTVTDSTSRGCAWTAASGAPWVTILNSAAGTGTGTVQLFVAPNAAGSRNGTITVAGQTIGVAQTAVPRFSLSGIVKEAWIDSGLGGVTVSVLSGPAPGTTTTDSRGAYSLNNLAAGSYRVSFSKPAFSTNALTVTVSGDTSFSTILNVGVTFPFTASDVSGYWAGGGPYPNEPFRVAFIQNGNLLSGFYVDRQDFSESLSGTINGRDVVFRVNVADGALLFECTIDEARNMRGVVKNERLGGNFPIVMTR